MANLKEVRTRIASVKSTQQITSAMKMVAASKLRKAQNAILQLRPYVNKLQEILQSISVSLESSDENIYLRRNEVNNVLFVVLTSNRGLCGAFNSNVIKVTTRYIEENYASYLKAGRLNLITIGKHASEYFEKNNYQVVEKFDTIYDSLTFDNVVPIAEKIMNEYAEGKYDHIEIIYNQFKNAAVQRLLIEQYLPVKSDVDLEFGEVSIDYIFEPSKEEIVNELIPKSLKLQFFKALLDSYASEQGARMTAMHLATDNATELLKELKVSYNKARQASITNEILEIVSGAEALKG